MPQGEYLQYGGQAIFEGVMMRSPRFFSVACRAPNGEIVTQTEALEKSWIGRQKWLKLPFLRGSLALLDAMALGIRAMRFASNVQLAAEYQKRDPNAPEPVEPAQVQPSSKVQDMAVGGAMVSGIVMGLLLFVFLPNWLAEGLRRFGVTESMQLNLASGLIKIVVFLGYLAIIGQMEAIKDVFRYHGAEHKAINTLEAEQELSIENCRQQTRLHPRCGTSFAVIVLLVSLLIFTFVPRYPLGQHILSVGFLNTLLNTLIRFSMEIVILPIIAGISYELLRLAGKFRNQTLVNLAFKPGIWTQFLTTREPNEGQIEVALLALKNVINAERKGSAVEPHEDALESAPIPIP
jgi:uncharacterized protein YqhQ